MNSESSSRLLDKPEEDLVENRTTTENTTSDNGRGAVPTHKKQPSFSFWGGCIMLISALAMFMSGPGQSFSVAVFIDPMLESLDLSNQFLTSWMVEKSNESGATLERTLYSIAYTVATLVGGFCLPFIGRLLDRYGARIMLPLVAVMLGLACYGMSLVTSFAGLCLGFMAIRCLGQGTLTLISTWMVSEWFAKRRGVATGLISLGGTVSVFVFSQVNRYVNDGYGWRMGWIVCGVAVVASLVIPSLLFVRNRPEDLGLLPDGASLEDLEEEKNNKTTDTKQEQLLLPDEESFELSEALQSPEFWKVCSVLAVSAMLGTGLIFHQISILAELEVSTWWAVNLIGFQALMATIASLGAGFLCDKNMIRGALIIAMASLTCSVGVLIVMPAPWFAVFYSGCLGFQGGIMRSAGTVVWPNYFGRLHQGEVRGMALSIQIYAAALGALPLALAKDFFDSYYYGLLLFLALPLMATLAIATLKRPVRRTA